MILARSALVTVTMDNAEDNHHLESQMPRPRSRNTERYRNEDVALQGNKSPRRSKARVASREERLRTNSMRWVLQEVDASSGHEREETCCSTRIMTVSSRENASLGSSQSPHHNHAPMSRPVGRQSTLQQRGVVSTQEQSFHDGVSSSPAETSTSLPSSSSHLVVPGAFEVRGQTVEQRRMRSATAQQQEIITLDGSNDAIQGITSRQQQQHRVESTASVRQQDEPTAELPIAAVVDCSSIHAHLQSLERRVNQIDQLPNPEGYAVPISLPTTSEQQQGGSNGEDRANSDSTTTVWKRRTECGLFLFLLIGGAVGITVAVMSARQSNMADPSSLSPPTTASPTLPVSKNTQTLRPTASPTRLPSSNNPPMTQQPTPFPSPDPTTSTPFPTKNPTRPPTRKPTPFPNAPPRTQWLKLGQDLRGKGMDSFAGHVVQLSRDGNVLAVGAPQRGSGSGYVVVYQFSDSQQTWVPMGQELTGPVFSDEFGWSISLNGAGTILAVGAFASDKKGVDTGHVSVYEFDEGSWIQQGYDILGDQSGDTFGASVSLSENGETLAVGASELTREGSGSVRLYWYNRETTSWLPMGQKLLGQASDDRFGVAVSVSNSGTIVAVGAHNHEAGGVEDAGQVTTYQYDSAYDSWEPMGAPLNGQRSGERFGFWVSLNANGSAMAVGSRDGGNDGTGSVSVFEFTGSSWTKRGQTLLGDHRNSKFGWSVSLSSDGYTVGVGSRFNSDNGERSGNVKIFEYNSNRRRWNQVGFDLNGGAPFDAFGYSVSLAGESRPPKVAVGAPQGGDGGRGYVQVYRFG